MGVISQRSGALYEAADYSERRIKLLNERRVLQAEDALKATFRNAHQVTYSALRETLIGLSKFDEALCAADQGRAQALLDLMKLRYEFELSASGSVEGKQKISEIIRANSSSKLFIALDEHAVNLWVLGKDRNVQFTRVEVR